MKNIDDIRAELQQKQQYMLNYIQKHWGVFLAEGILFIVLGIAAIVVPQVMSLVLVIFLGWLIVLGGVLHTSRSLLFWNMPGFGLWFGLGVLQIAMGYVLIAKPIAGLTTLTMMMTLFFALEGTFKIFLALMIRPLPQWNMMLFSGVTALIFAAVVLVFWQETEQWLLGLFLGINMLVLGVSMAKMSLYHKDNFS